MFIAFTWPFSDSLIENLGWVLVHSIWQVALIASLAMLLVRIMWRSSSAARYNVLVFAMTMPVACPIATWSQFTISKLDHSASRVALAPGFDFNNAIDARAETARLADDQNSAEHHATEIPLLGQLAPNIVQPAISAKRSSEIQPATAWTERAKTILEPWLAWIVTGWCLGVTICSLRPLLGWRTLRRLRRTGVAPVSDDVLTAMRRISEQLGVRRAVIVMQSTLAQVPVVVGYMRPMILLPVSLLTSIPAAQLDTILAHELAHIRRHDFLVNLLQTLAETFFFYHPAIWWLSRQTRVEREHCCDDLVIAALGNRIEYGRALLAIEELRGQSTLLALGANDGNLLSRIRRIADLTAEGSAESRVSRAYSSTGWLGCLVAMGFVLIVTIGSFLLFSDKSVAQQSGTPIEVTLVPEVERGADTPKSLKPFSAELPTGLKVELVGVTKNTGPASEGWRPDGQPLSDVDGWDHDFQVAINKSDNGNRSISTIKRGTSILSSPDARDLLVRFTGLKQQPSYILSPFNGAVGWSQNRFSEPFLNRLSILQKESQPIQTIRLGITDDPWGEWQQVSPTGDLLNQLDEASSYWASYQSIQLQRVGPYDKDVQNTQLDLTWPKDRRDLFAFEIRAIDLDGAAVNVINESEANDEARVLKARFILGDALPRNRLARFEYRLRPYRHWVTFENVALQPGINSEVKMTVEHQPLVAATIPYESVLENGLVSHIRESEELFARKVSLTAKDMPLKDALMQLSRAAKVELQLDADALKQGNLDVEQTVTVTIKDEPFGDALSQLITFDRYPNSPTRTIVRGKLVITSLRAFLEASNASQAEIVQHLPDWLRPLYNQGISVKLDDEHNIVSISADVKVTDVLLGKLKLLPKLRALTIHSLKADSTEILTTSVLAHLAELTSLQGLSISNTSGTKFNLGDLAIQNIAGLKLLREISLKECGTTDAGVRLLEGMPLLKHLTISGEGQLTDSALTSIGKLKHLKMLDLADLRAGFSQAGLSQLSGLKELEELNLVGKAVPADAIGSPRLRTLRLGHFAVDDACASRIAECRDLRSLSLSSTSITNEGWKKIATLPELHQLILNREGITDVGIGHLKNLHKLNHLTLRSNKLTDAALVHLAEIKSLTRLDVWGDGSVAGGGGSRLTATGLQHLARLPDLRTLWLNNFTDGSGYGELKELTQLRELVFDMSNLNQRQFNELEVAMPKVRIRVGNGAGYLRSIREPKAQPVAIAMPGLRISGKVVDAETGQPIAKVRIMPKSVSHDDGELNAWESRHLKEFTDGRYLYESDKPYDKTKIRIEADGYRPFATRVVNLGEKPVEIDVKLVREVFAGVVLRPTGQPAAEAQLAIASSWTNEVTVRSGKLSYFASPSYMGRKIVEADEQGRFELPSEIDPSVLVVAHDAGYAEVVTIGPTAAQKARQSSTTVEPKLQNNRAMTITLQPWGRVEGRVMVLDKPLAGAKYSLYQARVDDFTVQTDRIVESDEEGRFVVEQFPPGSHGKCDRYMQNSDGLGGRMVNGLHSVFDIPPGTTATLQLGSPGRNVIGKLALPVSFPHKIDWSKVGANVALRRPRHSPRIGEDEKAFQLMSKFLQTDEGKLYVRDNVAIASDGSFSIEGLPAAEYILTVIASGEAVIGGTKPETDVVRSSKEFQVPASILSDTASPIDLGTIEL